ncbi:MAG: SDR family NAD(P)-dependent oxidoreductase [Alphaproteobacteria bacterium]|nr:SDR family NAD(P)-dependent oxidoreductase [Alphaproteobacteria bacterium]
MSGELEGRVAVVTGAAGGIGREFVSGLLGAGAKVAALDIDEGRLGALEADASGGRLMTARVDISSYAGCEAAVGQVAERLGPPDILVNNGAMGMGVIRADHMTNLVEIHEIDPEVWDRMVAVNLSGAWYMTRAAVGSMLDRGWGRIVNVTTSFFTMLRGRFHPYGPAKSGLEAMSAGHAAEFADRGVTVNVVVPGGPTDTPMVPEESGIDRALMVRPSAMVPPVLWLCSGEGGAWTGHRYVAGNWDAAAAPALAAEGCRAPIAWPELAQSPVWPGGRPPV